jgi:hypothetical protein
MAVSSRRRGALDLGRGSGGVTDIGGKDATDREILQTAHSGHGGATSSR